MSSMAVLQHTKVEADLQMRRVVRVTAVWRRQRKSPRGPEVKAKLQSLMRCRMQRARQIEEVTFSSRPVPPLARQRHLHCTKKRAGIKGQQPVSLWVPETTNVCSLECVCHPLLLPPAGMYPNSDSPLAWSVEAPRTA